MDFEKLIDERYSVRDFKSEHLEQNVVDKILKAGISALDDYSDYYTYEEHMDFFNNINNVREDIEKKRKRIQAINKVMLRKLTQTKK